MRNLLSTFSFLLPRQSFGTDKEIYVYFFIVVVVYNFFLCLYAVSCFTQYTCHRQHTCGVPCDGTLSNILSCYSVYTTYQV